MAEKVTMLVEIDGDVKSYEGAIKQAEAATDGFANKLTEVTKVAAIAFAGLSGAIGYSVKQFSDAQAVQAKLNATLESTKFAAGLSATELTNMADALSKVSTFDDEAILGAENLLLSFTKIGKEVFPQAIQAAADLAGKFGSLDAAALAIGKALERPTEGLGALSRAGINFTEDEVKVFQALIDTGKAAEAQTEILKKLSTISSGQAAAAANTLSGQMAQMQTAFNNVAESIGAVYAPILQQVVTQIKNFFLFIQENPALIKFGATMLGISTAIAGLVASVGGAVPAFKQLSTFLPIINVLLTGTTTAVRTLAGATGIGLVIVAITLLIQYWDEVQSATSAAAFAIFATVQSLATSMITVFTSLGAAIKAAVTGNFSEAISQAGAAVGAITGQFSRAGLAASSAYAEGKLIGKQLIDNANMKIATSEVQSLDEQAHIADVKRKAENDAIIAAQEAELKAAQDKKDGLLSIESSLADESISIYDYMGDGTLGSYESTTDDLLAAARDRSSALASAEGTGDRVSSTGEVSGQQGLGGVGTIYSDTAEGRKLRAALRSNPNGFNNFVPGATGNDLLKAVIKAVSAGGFQFKEGYSGEGFLGRFNGREIVIPKNFADGIKQGDFALTGGRSAVGGGSKDVNVSVGFNGREASRVLTARQNQDRAVGTSREI